MKTKRSSLLALIGLVVVALGLSALSYFGIGRSHFLGASNIKQGLDLQGGVAIVYEAAAENPTVDEMKSAISLIQDRLDRRGWTEAEVAQQGNKRIRLDIPGVDNAETAIAELGRTAKLTFQDENGNIVLEGSEIVSARKDVMQKSQGSAVQNVVLLEFTSSAQAKFAEATRNNIGKPIYIMLDQDIISDPVVNSEINQSTAYIEGNFTPESAEELAALIRAGALPFNLEVMNMSNVGAKLGANSLETSLLAGLIGICIVLLFMFAVYKVAGLVADLALIIYVGIVLVFLSAFEITLTLPGIAGIILSIGMAVDANVIIFERLKEELKAGKTMRTALDLAFKRAFSAILDGNVTTLISAAVLFWLGTGPIKGFAQTLALGIVVSMFTAIVITRLLLRCVMGLGVAKPSLYGVNEKKDSITSSGKVYRIIENKIKFFIISAALIGAGIVVMLVQGIMGNGIMNFDVEFSGGLSLMIDMGQDFNNDDIAGIIAETTGQTSPQIQRITGTNEVSVKIRSIEQDVRIAMLDKLAESYPDMELSSMDDVSGTVSGEMQTTAVMAVAVACLGMLIYVSLRFRDIRLGGSAILALVHDAMVMLTAYAVLRIPVNYSFIAAILTVIGYSINSNIVIFDRMRENKKNDPKRDMVSLVNGSVRQTMTRSIYTTLTTLFTITCVAILGVQSVREFSIPIIIGIICGTYSSICIAGNLWHWFCVKTGKTLA